MATPYYIIRSHIEGCVIRSVLRVVLCGVKKTPYHILWNHIDGCVMRSVFYVIRSILRVVYWRQDCDFSYNNCVFPINTAFYSYLNFGYSLSTRCCILCMYSDYKNDF